MNAEEIEKQEELVSSLHSRWTSMVLEADKMWAAWDKKEAETNELWEQWLSEFRKLKTIKENTNEKAK